jgi:hypothetical protein
VSKSPQIQRRPQIKTGLMPDVTIVCPACARPAPALINGVCPNCKRIFKAAHRGKLQTEWRPEDFRYRGACSVARVPEGSPVIMDEEDAAKAWRREVVAVAREEAADFYKRLLRLVIQYQGDQVMALQAACIAMEWFELVGCEEATELAVKLYGNPKRKAAVSKAVKMFQDALGIEPGRGQRSDSARRAMGNARKKQLTTDGHG